MPALEIICLTPTLIAVSITTGETIHNIEVIWTAFSLAITVLGKVTSIDWLSAWCSSNSKLKKKKGSETHKYVWISWISAPTWQLLQHSPWEQADPLVSLQVAASQHLLLHSCRARKDGETMLTKAVKTKQRKKRTGLYDSSHNLCLCHLGQITTWL